MADSDALIVVEDWISEHYFTTDARKESFLGRVLDRVKAWKESETPTTRSRFTSARSRLATDLAALYSYLEQRSDIDEPADALDIHAHLRGILGFDEPGAFATQVNGPLRLVRRPGLPSALAIIDAVPASSLEELFARHAKTLPEPYLTDDEVEITSAGKLVSEVFLNNPDVGFALVQAGRWLVIAEGSRWPEGRYLAIDIQTVAERGDLKQGGELDRALVALDADSLAPDAEGATWWAATLEASVAHTVGVSADLREGVRASIEVIANEVVNRRRDKGLDALPQASAQPLAVQSLRFLYRILFLLYAEASPELGVLPAGDPDYARGYSLDRLRELVQVELATPQARTGGHLYESLRVLFRLVDKGHAVGFSDDGLVDRGLEFHALRADLFTPQATSLIDEVGLGNQAVQEVLRRLLLSKEVKGRERGFISYVELGINQLGAVYEGLMSYTGSFAEVDLYEVARAGNTEKGSWVVPVDRADDLADADFVRDTDPVTGQTARRRYTAGQFVFRLSGRERQRSASYYTPEVLTKFTVSQALEELLDQDGAVTTAEEILGLSVCEPALGSGAFAIEAVRQLAEQYLRRRQEELGERIDPENYAEELQRVKAHIALHNVYGVDLNATAVEFAEITLWLDTMARDLAAPWFGLRLRRGNSLIGGARSFYSREKVESKAWLTTPPTPEPLTDIARRVAEDRPELSGTGGRIHHWLLPASGWGATADSKEAAKLVPERVKAVKSWRTKAKAKPSKRQLDRLVNIAHQADELWALAYKRLVVAEQESARHIRLWKRDAAPAAQGHVTREQIEDSLSDPDGAYRRLRRVLDAWCALWFWPLTGDEVTPPSLDDWIDAAAGLLGERVTVKQKKGYSNTDTLAPSDAWEALADQESFELSGGNAQPVAKVLEDHPWLAVCERVAQEQGFFHWQLDFATVFGRGGFDLQVGNPPWVRPRGDVEGLLAEFDPWWTLSLKPSEADKRERRVNTLQVIGAVPLVVSGDGEVSATAAFLGSSELFPELAGLQPDLYRCFMARTWAHVSERGAIGLLHPESHFTDEKAGPLREATYQRLRRHWQFKNELLLFREIDDQVVYGFHVYGRARPVHFVNASGLYHPDTVTRSLHHDGSGDEPGFKYEGRWDQRPHHSRIQLIDEAVLGEWRDVLEGQSTQALRTRMLYSVNRSSADVLARLASAKRVGTLGLEFSRGWDESIDRKKGRFVQGWGTPKTWQDVILQGPNLHISRPFFKSPNPTMKHNQDWTPVDLEALAPDAMPVTSYKPAGDRATYDAAYGTWDGAPIRDHYRVAWRCMAANGGERTLIPGIIPKGATHVDGIFSAGGIGSSELATLAAVLGSLFSDLQVRAAPKSTIRAPQIERLATVASDTEMGAHLRWRALRLNCVTNAYADLWETAWEDAFVEMSPLLSWRSPVPNPGRIWTSETPLRGDLDRRNALVEIDALVATMLGVTADELCTIYRTQFAVLHGYDQNTYFYDANGRLVPTSVLQVWRKKGDAITLEERTAVHPGSGVEYVYELPFASRDREADFREAMAAIERLELS